MDILYLIGLLIFGFNGLAIGFSSLFPSPAFMNMTKREDYALRGMMLLTSLMMLSIAKILYYRIPLGPT
jgi:hypothetical protein